VLFIDRIGLNAESCATVATLVVPIDLEVREVIGFGKLPSDLGRVSLPESRFLEGDLMSSATIEDVS
jgi:hypothetical protein